MRAGDITLVGTRRAGLLDTRRRRGWLLLLCAALVSLAASPTARASTFNVNTTSDNGATSTSECAGAPGDCSLRQAIHKAANSAGDDTIFVPSGQYKLSQGALLVAEPSLVIIGADARNTEIDGPGGTRVFGILNGASPSISQLTITGGLAFGLDSQGGGIRVESGGVLTLSNSTVRNNTALGSSTNGSGGGIYNAGTLVASRDTINGNTASTLTASPTTIGIGGGIDNEGALTLVNSTITNNTAGGGNVLGQGGGLATAAAPASGANPFSMLTNVTLTSNITGLGGAGPNLSTASKATSAQNTIVALAGDANCSGAIQSNGNNLEDRSTCGLGAAGDRSNTSPNPIGDLAPNGGPTDTQALFPGSPAIDAGSNSGCPSSDELAVGSTPNPPSHANPPSVLGATLPPAVLGKTFNLVPVRGTVTYLLPNGRRYNPLQSAVQAPLGTIVEASDGKARVISARNSAGLQQNADFYDGPFQVRQSLDPRKPGVPRTGITDLFLRFGDFGDCDRADRKQIQAVAARKRRRLWGKGKGAYRTRGNYGSASVRGTWWFTKDFCDGTEFFVREGVVKVRDNTRRRTVTIRAGQRYIAKAPPDHVLPRRGSQ
jgi:hypothetical protein